MSRTGEGFQVGLARVAAWALAGLLAWGLWALAPALGPLLGGAWENAVDLRSAQARLGAAVLALAAVAAARTLVALARGAGGRAATIAALVLALPLLSTGALGGPSPGEALAPASPSPAGARLAGDAAIAATPLALQGPTAGERTVVVSDPERAYTEGEALRLARLVRSGGHVVVADDTQRTRHLLAFFDVSVTEGRLWDVGPKAPGGGLVRATAELGNRSINLTLEDPRGLSYTVSDAEVQVIATTAPVVWDANLDGRAGPGDPTGERPVALVVHPRGAAGTLTLLSDPELVPVHSGGPAPPLERHLLGPRSDRGDAVLPDLSVRGPGRGMPGTVLRAAHVATASRAQLAGVPIAGVAATVLASAAGVLAWRGTRRPSGPAGPSVDAPSTAELRRALDGRDAGAEGPPE